MMRRDFKLGENQNGRKPRLVIRQITVMGFAIAALLSVNPAKALAAPGANCVSTSGDFMNVGGDGSSCDAFSDGSGKAKATAKGNSGANSEVVSGDKATAVATDHSFAEAESQGSSCPAKATANHGASAASLCFGQGGSAQATASNGADLARADAGAACKATAKATGAGSDAIAECSTPGGFVNATATNGGFAEGSDTDSPNCVPNGGTAKVRSTGGNCG